MSSARALSVSRFDMVHPVDGNRLSAGRRSELLKMAKTWFYRLAAVQFLITALTGLVLYLRPLSDRPGAYSHGIKEVLVMLHNGEWLTYVLFRNRYLSGFVVGMALTALVACFANRVLRGAHSGAEKCSWPTTDDQDSPTRSSGAGHRTIWGR